MYSPLACERSGDLFSGPRGRRKTMKIAIFSKRGHDINGKIQKTAPGAPKTVPEPPKTLKNQKNTYKIKLL